MTTESESNHVDAQPEDTQAGVRARLKDAAREEMGDVNRAMREVLDKSKGVATNVGGSLRESLNSVRSARDSVVMVRVSKESLRKMDSLVDCGLTKSRSEAAAFLISEGIKAKADMYDKIAAQSEVIRNAREELSRLLYEEPDDEDYVNEDDDPDENGGVRRIAVG